MPDPQKRLIIVLLASHWISIAQLFALPAKKLAARGSDPPSVQRR
jgi:hypothetical protein